MVGLLSRFGLFLMMKSKGNCVQALTDLLQLPSVVLKFIQQQLTGEGVVWAIDSSRPGHCIWQLKKLLGCSAPAPAAPGTVNLDGAPRAHWECVPPCQTFWLMSNLMPRFVMLFM
jgi:hypothetical protein